MSIEVAQQKTKRKRALQEPKVWAETIQELCEGTDYFHSYQSAVYTRDNAAISILLNGFPAQRDVFRRGVFITHGGGRSCEVISKDGSRHFRLSSSQTRSDPGVRSLFNSMIKRQPLVAIIGDKYQLVDFDIPHPYCVLGWYAITHAWAELEDAIDGDNNGTSYNRHIRYKFRFERLENQDPPWWYDEAPLANELHPSEGNICDYDSIFLQNGCSFPFDFNKLNPVHGCFKSHMCYICGSNYPRVFSEVFVCLNESCSAFWKVEMITSNDELLMTKLTSGLSYEPKFVSTTFIKSNSISQQLPLSVIPNTKNKDINCRACYCRRCGRISCREELYRWQCPTCGNFSLFQVQALKPSMSVLYGLQNEMRTNNVETDEIITEKRMGTNGTNEIIYTIPKVGFIIHKIAQPQLFEETLCLLNSYLAEDESRPPFRRCRLSRAPLGIRPFLSNQFQFNVGEPYKFVTSVDTIPFSEAPESVIQAMNILKRETGYQDFNELLSIAYLQGQKIGWHDDGEKEVGEVIATLSLGSPATMYFRRHRLQSRRYEKNQEKAMLGNYTRRKEKQSVLDLNLRHGDVLIMHGRSIQKYFEHQVVPQGFRIAITARRMLNS
ncbi:hypothetical protein K7432_000932 [Basidiobolus ranarum]|uniref:Fe2OG dioxygenase domain-containing protein n=1 Tax=Basidiobolus ranarum TaxID=34480 RepID=A0ABR2WAD9_9FUNG